MLNTRSDWKFLSALIALVALVACGHKGQPSANASLPPLLINDRGVVMPLEQAVTKIGFRPYLPPGQILAFAVIPPLGGLDTVPNRGLAIEYVAGRQAMLLSQWPKQSFTLGFLSKDITASPCVIVHYKPDGVAWTSRRGLLLTLQPDGTVSAASVDKEARRLLRAGACA